MTRLPEGTIIVKRGISLLEEEILRLEIEMVERGHLDIYDTLGYDTERNLVIFYGEEEEEDNEIEKRKR